MTARFARGCFAALFLPCLLPAQGLEFIKATYTKYEYRIPMRDGKRLFTAVYVPKDGAQAYPFLILRTPYSVAPYGADRYPDSLGPSEKLARDGYIFVSQDVRGRYQSEGVFIEVTPHKAIKRGAADVDESSDTYDTIDWLVRHVPNNNGRAGTWGISYPGFYAAAGILGAHPAHKAASPQAPMIDLFRGDDSYHNGALMLAANFGFYGSFKPHREPTLPGRFVPFEFGTPDGYDWYLHKLGPLGNSSEVHFRNENPYWDSTVQHWSYDEFWQSRNLAAHVKDVRPAILTVGGWFDGEDLQGALRLDGAIAQASPETTHTLVMGPWSHGGWFRGEGNKLGNVSFNVKAGEYYRERILEPFFQFHLKSKGDWKSPKAWMFETGANLWRRFETWPPREAVEKTLYFQAAGGLNYVVPGESAAFDEYVSDPSRPVPHLGFTAMGYTAQYMVEDQRFAARRPDVLVYQTPVLNEDVTFAGPVRPLLHVSTSGTDSDFIVKLIDVYPNDYPDPEPNPAGLRMGGYQQLVRGEPFRGKFRASFEHPEPFTPGKVETIDYTMPDICHTFRRGHRIMVQVQSSWFPLIDRNPQKFMDIPKAREADFQKATERVMRSRESASGVRVRVLPAN